MNELVSLLWGKHWANNAMEAQGIMLIWYYFMPTCGYKNIFLSISMIWLYKKKMDTAQGHKTRSNFISHFQAFYFLSKRKWQPLNQTQRPLCIHALTVFPKHLTQLYHNLRSTLTDWSLLLLPLLHILWATNSVACRIYMTLLTVFFNCQPSSNS